VFPSSPKRREHHQKRKLYIDRLGVPHYWIVDPDARTLRQARPGFADQVLHGEVHWHPRGAGEALVFPVNRIFRDL
jgi:Uma2 family endonuclease